MARALYLKIGIFNINGFVGQKTFDPEFSIFIQKYDIVALNETWHSKKECKEKLKHNIPSNYLYFHNPRKHKHKRSKRNSGGIILFYKKHLHNNITIHDQKTENMLWIKINKNYLNFDQDIFVCAVYNSPINSSYAQRQESDFFYSLQEKMTSFSPHDYILIGGDFNARTNTLPDYVYESQGDANFINFPDNYEIDQFTTLRNNQDIHTNSHGKKLIDFAISTKMRILNGRTLGDLLGKFTYIGYNGVGTVDMY